MKKFKMFLQLFRDKAYEEGDEQLENFITAVPITVEVDDQDYENIMRIVSSLEPALSGVVYYQLNYFNPLTDIKQALYRDLVEYDGWPVDVADTLLNVVENHEALKHPVFLRIEKDTENLPPRIVLGIDYLGDYI